VVFAENTADNGEVVYYEQYFPRRSMPFCEREENNAPQMTGEDIQPIATVKKLRREYDNLWPVSTVHREDISLGTQLPSLADFLWNTARTAAAFRGTSHPKRYPCGTLSIGSCNYGGLQPSMLGLPVWSW
jgi:hypothetical protein